MKKFGNVILLGVLSFVAKYLLNYLSPDLVRRVCQRGLAFLRKLVEDSPADWDNAIVLPLIDVLDEVLAQDGFAEGVKMGEGITMTDENLAPGTKEREAAVKRLTELGCIATSAHKFLWLEIYGDKFDFEDFFEVCRLCQPFRQILLTIPGYSVEMKLCDHSET